MANKTTIMVSSYLRTIATMTVVTSILWTAYGVYNALSKPDKLDIPATLLAPVTASIDKETINKLAERRQLSEEVSSDDFVKQALQLMTQPITQHATAGATVIPEINQIEVAASGSAEATSAASL